MLQRRRNTGGVWKVVCAVTVLIVLQCAMGDEGSHAMEAMLVEEGVSESVAMDVLRALQVSTEADLAALEVASIDTLDVSGVHPIQMKVAKEVLHTLRTRLREAPREKNRKRHAVLLEELKAGEDEFVIISKTGALESMVEAGTVQDKASAEGLWALMVGKSSGKISYISLLGVVTNNVLPRMTTGWLLTALALLMSVVVGVLLGVQIKAFEKAHEDRRVLLVGSYIVGYSFIASGLEDDLYDIAVALAFANVLLSLVVVLVIKDNSSPENQERDIWMALGVVTLVSLLQCYLVPYTPVYWLGAVSLNLCLAKFVFDNAPTDMPIPFYKQIESNIHDTVSEPTSESTYVASTVHKFNFRNRESKDLFNPGVLGSVVALLMSVTAHIQLVVSSSPMTLGIASALVDINVIVLPCCIHAIVLAFAMLRKEARVFHVEKELVQEDAVIMQWLEDNGVPCLPKDKAPVITYMAEMHLMFLVDMVLLAYGMIFGRGVALTMASIGYLAHVAGHLMQAGANVAVHREIDGVHLAGYVFEHMLVMLVTNVFETRIDTILGVLNSLLYLLAGPFGLVATTWIKIMEHNYSTKERAMAYPLKLVAANAVLLGVSVWLQRRMLALGVIGNILGLTTWIGFITKGSPKFLMGLVAVTILLWMGAGAVF